MTKHNTAVRYMYVCMNIYAHTYIYESESVSHPVMSDSVTQWTIALQSPLSIRFPRQECWSVWPFPSPGNLHDAGIKPRSPALQADSLPAEPPGKPCIYIYMHVCFWNFSFFPNTSALNTCLIVCKAPSACCCF